MVSGLGFRFGVSCPGFGILVSDFKDSSFGFRVRVEGPWRCRRLGGLRAGSRSWSPPCTRQCLRALRTPVAGFRVSVFGFRVSGSGFRVSDSGVSGSGFMFFCFEVDSFSSPTDYSSWHAGSAVQTRHLSSRKRDQIARDLQPGSGSEAGS